MEAAQQAQRAADEQSAELALREEQVRARPGVLGPSLAACGPPGPPASCQHRAEHARTCLVPRSHWGASLPLQARQASEQLASRQAEVEAAKASAAQAALELAARERSLAAQEAAVAEVKVS